MKRLLAVLLVLAVGCSTQTPSVTPTSVRITAPPTSTTVTIPDVDACDPPRILPTVLPSRVSGRQPPTSAIPLDRFTTLPGTTIRFWADENGDPVVVLIRGALPPGKWTAAPEHVTVLGVDAAMGPLDDGIWAVGWFEGVDRCDEYSIIFYPPVDSAEARAVAEGLRGN